MLLLRFLCLQQFLNFRRFDGCAEVVALILVAIEALQELQLVGGFNSFGEHLQTKRFGKCHNTSRDDSVIIVGNVFNKCSIDLKSIQWELTQVSK